MEGKIYGLDGCIALYTLSILNHREMWFYLTVETKPLANSLFLCWECIKFRLS